MSAAASAPPARGTSQDAANLIDVVDALQAHSQRPLPDAATRAAQRTLFNILAVAIGAGRAPGVQRLAVAGAAGLTPASPSVLAAAPTTAAHAALVTGFAGHYDDYDDTHLATVIHPAAACLGAAWSAGTNASVTGSDLLRAVALGCEVQLRLGNAVSPEHYDRGWHITGTCGVVGATVTAALLRGLDRHQTWAALAMACTRTLGHREAFGTELKPFHAGQAAANAVRAATHAAHRRDWDPHTLPHDPLRLLLATLAPDSADPAELLSGFGDRWELAANAIKPYPCGIVAHPGIDAGIDARAALRARGLSAGHVVHVEYRCHPLVPELMGRRWPAGDLEARFSAVHGVAAGLVHGRAGLAEFSAATATAPALAAVRDRIRFVPDEHTARDAATLTVHVESGETIQVTVPHARGSEARPLTDHELTVKAAELLALGEGPGAESLWAWVRSLHDDSGQQPWRRFRNLDAQP